MPSFDVASEVDMVEVRNATDQANKEITNRFDFKGSNARIELGEKSLTLFADDDFKLSQVKDIFFQKLSKRGVDVRSFRDAEVGIQKISGAKVKLELMIQVGVAQDVAKQIVKVIKENKVLKLQASIQGDTVRIVGSKKDALQEAISVLKKHFEDAPLQYQNFRD